MPELGRSPEGQGSFGTFQQKKLAVPRSSAAAQLAICQGSVRTTLKSSIHGQGQVLRVLCRRISSSAFTWQPGLLYQKKSARSVSQGSSLRDVRLQGKPSLQGIASLLPPTWDGGDRKGNQAKIPCLSCGLCHLRVVSGWGGHPRWAGKNQASIGRLTEAPWGLQAASTRDDFGFTKPCYVLQTTAWVTPLDWCPLSDHGGFPSDFIALRHSSSLSEKEMFSQLPTRDSIVRRQVVTSQRRSCSFHSRISKYITCRQEMSTIFLTLYQIPVPQIQAPCSGWWAEISCRAWVSWMSSMGTAGQVALQKHVKLSPALCKGWTLVLATNFYKKFGFIKKQNTMMGQLPHPEDDGFVLGYSAGVVWLACVFLTSPREKKKLHLGPMGWWTDLHSSEKQWAVNIQHGVVRQSWGMKPMSIPGEWLGPSTAEHGGLGRTGPGRAE